MIKLLILDAEEGICDQLKKFFDYRGYKVFAVTDTNDALSVIEKEKPHILVLDILMRGVGALEVLKKAKEENPNVRAIMITVKEDETTKYQAKELGVDECITKPFSYDVLERLIIRLVNEVIKLRESKK